MSLRRPILKCLPTAESQPENPFRGGRVHFPPTPNISAVYFAHSARTYDRSAIVVSPNDCSLPQRHCPDRTYVLSEAKGEARLLKSVQPREMQKDDEDADDTPGADCDQEAGRLDYFSITSPSSIPEMAWSESDDSDELIYPPNDISPNFSNPPIPMLDVSVHNNHAHEASNPHEHVQATLACLPHLLPPAPKRNVPPRDRERQDRAHCFSVGESSTPLARSSRPRRASSFTADVLPDFGCLGGF